MIWGGQRIRNKNFYYQQLLAVSVTLRQTKEEPLMTRFSVALCPVGKSSVQIIAKLMLKKVIPFHFF